MTFSGSSEQAEVEAKANIAGFVDYITQHKDEIAALSFFYQEPYQRRALTFDMIEVLFEYLNRSPLMLTTERLWGAYARVQTNQVKGVERKRQLTWSLWFGLHWDWKVGSNLLLMKWINSSKPRFSGTASHCV